MKLCINSDDYGYTPEINLGIREGASAGVVTSCSAMTVLGLHGDVRSLSESGVSVGLHFCLTLPIPGRVSCAGPLTLARRVALGRLEPAAVRAELERQYAELAEVLGQPPSHLDCHHHVHALPMLRRIVTDFCDREQLPAVRVPRDTTGPRSVKSWLLRFAFRREPSTRTFMGLHLSAGRFREASIRRALDQLAARGAPSVEWMVHVGRYSPGLQGRDPYNAQRVGELETLLALGPYLRANLDLVSMRELP